MPAYVACLLAAALGVLALLVLANGHELLPHSGTRSEGHELQWRSWAPAILTGMIATVATRWPVAGVVIGAAVYLWPRMARGGTIERAGIAKLEALATWTESLRDAATSAAALETAIPLTLRGAPQQLEPVVRDLVNCLAVRVPLPEALSRFADSVDDASADLVVAALSLNARQRGGSLRRVLTVLAEHTREELSARRQVSKERGAIRRQSQQIAGAMLLLVVGQAVVAPGWVEPYGTPTGQLILAVLGGCYLALAIRLQHLGVPEPAPRFLSTPSVVTEMASWRPEVTAR
jgi:tight adherence protein B